MIKNLVIASAFVLSLFSSETVAKTVTIENNPGGMVVSFLANRHYYQNSGNEIKLAGYCMSACTMYIAMPNTCLDKDAEFWFHQGSTIWATAKMLENWPVGLKNKVLAYELPSYSSDEWIVLGSEEISEVAGTRICN